MKRARSQELDEYQHDVIESLESSAKKRRISTSSASVLAPGAPAVTASYMPAFTGDDDEPIFRPRNLSIGSLSSYRSRRSCGSIADSAASSVSKRKLTDPVPFRLYTDLRGELHANSLAYRLRLQEEREHHAKQFKARPMLVFEPKDPPKPAPRPLTTPYPFNLQSELRRDIVLTKLASKMDKENWDAHYRTEFKARPVSAKLLSYPLFVPRTSDRPLTEVYPFDLKTETRSYRRAEFDAYMAEKSRLAEEEKQRREEERRQQEQENIKYLRKQLDENIRAKPMPVFDKPFVPRPSAQPLTTPVSPRLAVLRSLR